MPAAAACPRAKAHLHLMLAAAAALLTLTPPCMCVQHQHPPNVLHCQWRAVMGRYLCASLGLSGTSGCQGGPPSCGHQSQQRNNRQRAVGGEQAVNVLRLLSAWAAAKLQCCGGSERQPPTLHPALLPCCRVGCPTVSALTARPLLATRVLRVQRWTTQRPSARR